jgi:hypothetical protein
MIALGFADGAQSVVHLVTGFFTIYQTTWAPWFVKAMGVIATPGYVFYAVLTIVLSLDRLVVVAFPKAEHVLFSKRGVKVNNKL